MVWSSDCPQGLKDRDQQAGRQSGRKNAQAAVQKKMDRMEETYVKL